MNQRRIALCLLILVLDCPASAEITVYSKIDPKLSWKCKDPSSQDALTTAQYQGCTPDALCNPLTGTSNWTNLFGFTDYQGHSYDGRCGFFNGNPVLQQGLGWFVVVGLGAIFAILVSFIQWIANAKVEHNSTMSTSSEHFGSAGRSVGSGWIACHIVSQWTWAATLLQSSNVAFKFGVSGPFWYAAGATIQVLLFSILAVEIKRKCPAVHTVCEICLARWGFAAHITFIIFVLTTMMIVTAMLILGGAAVVTALSGMNIYAASFLIPISAVPFTMHGGLQATFISAWAHVTIIFVVMLIFLWKVYADSGQLGSTDRVWDLLSIQAEKNPVLWNRDGSYLTMWSTSGVIFGITNIIGNFGTVFCDQTYWQGAIAAKPSATYKGYLLGGLSWFSIPFSMATTLGLSARALDLPITLAEADAGLVPPAVATHMLGAGGSFMILLQLFMAVTASAAAEQVGISSIVAYDIYKRYINPQATGKQILFTSRAAIAVWACMSGILSIILFEMNIDLGWVYAAMGNFVGSAVVPIAFALTWKDCSAVGAMAGAWLGLASAMIGWCLCAQRLGPLNVKNLGDDFSMLAANVIALTVSPIITVLVSKWSPQNFDWSELRRRTEDMLVEDDIAEKDRVSHKELLGLNEDLSTSEAISPHNAGGWLGRGWHAMFSHHHTETEDAMARVVRFSSWFGGGLSFVLIIIWPLLALAQPTFSKSYWGWWVAIAFMWGHCAAAVTTILPIWQVRTSIGVALGIIAEPEPSDNPPGGPDGAHPEDLADKVILAVQRRISNAARKMSNVARRMSSGVWDSSDNDLSASTPTAFRTSSADSSAPSDVTGPSATASKTLPFQPVFIPAIETASGLCARETGPETKIEGCEQPAAPANAARAAGPEITIERCAQPPAPANAANAAGSEITIEGCEQPNVPANIVGAPSQS